MLQVRDFVNGFVPELKARASSLHVKNIGQN